MKRQNIGKLTYFRFIMMVTMLLMAPTWAFASESSLRIQPQAVTLSEVGKEISVDIQVSNVANLYGVDFKLAFDPTVVEVTKMEQGNVFPSDQTLSIRNTIDNSSGKLHFAHIFLGDVKGFSGNGTLAKVTFKAKSINGTTLTITDGTIVDSSDGAISATIQNGTLVVGNASQPQLPGNNQTNPGPKPPTGNTPSPIPGNPPVGYKPPQSPTVPAPVTPPLIGGKKLKDVEKHWAKAEVEKLVSKGIISGYPDGSFRPEAKVTRAEFIKMVTLALNNKNFTAAGNLNYKDSGQIQPWAKSYFEVAVTQGLIKGDSNNKVNPNASISRAEMAAIIVRALGLEAEAKAYKTPLPFKDSSKIDAWARGYIGIAYGKKVITGYPDLTFKADALASRAQAAKLISQLVK